MGNRLETQHNGVAAESLRYDDNNQLLRATVAQDTPAGGTLSSFALNASGNRTSVTTDGVSTSYAAANPLNQYPAVGGKAATYDGNGNLATYNGWTYIYDALNRLTRAANVSAGQNAYFYYDGLNRQVARNLTGESTHFSVWDGWNLFAEYDPNNVWNRTTVHGLPGDLVEKIEAGVPNTIYYPDGLAETSLSTSLRPQSHSVTQRIMLLGLSPLTQVSHISSIMLILVFTSRAIRFKVSSTALYFYLPTA